MRTVEDDEPFHDLRAHQRRSPRYSAAPIVPDHDRAIAPERMNQIGDITDQLLEAVVRDSNRRIGLAVTAHLGSDAVERVR